MWVARESEGFETSLGFGSGTDSCGQEDSDRTRGILGRELPTARSRLPRRQHPEAVHAVRPRFDLCVVRTVLHYEFAN